MTDSNKKYPKKVDHKEEILRRLTPYQVYGNDIKPNKDGYKCKCQLPNHTEKTASFIIRPDLSFICFGCHEKGSVFDFYMKKHGVEFKEALHALAEMVGVDIKSGAPAESHARLYACLKAAQDYYVSNLAKSPDIMQYLIEERKLTEETIKKFGLGCTNGTPVVTLLKSLGFTDDEIVKSGLAFRKEGEKTARDLFYERRITIPIKEVGRILAFGGRIFVAKGATSNSPKFLNTYDSPIFKKRTVLFAFNPAAVKEKGSLNLVEGYFDAIYWHQEGLTNTAACLSAELTKEHIYFIKEKCGFTPRIVPVFDGDAAGVRASQKSVMSLFEHYISGAVVQLPEGEDPDTYLQKTGSVAPILNGAIPFSVYLTNNFPDIKDWIFNELLKRDNPIESCLHLAHNARSEDVEALRQMNARAYVERRLADTVSLIKEDKVEIKIDGKYLIVLSKGRFLFYTPVVGDDVIAQAKDICEDVICARAKKLKDFWVDEPVAPVEAPAKKGHMLKRSCPGY